ncbi:MAG: hypothetical protein IMX00_04380 [Limnochordales bacterium]|nr:hypothetical protein [Limnochordales bacterium]
MEDRDLVQYLNQIREQRHALQSVFNEATDPKVIDTLISWISALEQEEARVLQLLRAGRAA